MQGKRFWRIVIPTLIALWTLFIWAQSLQSAADSSADSSRIARFIMHLFGWETQPDWLTYAIRKTAHFAEFGVLGVLWGACGVVYPRRLTWLWGVPTGAIDECLQFFAPGRAPMVIDVVIDIAGYLCGVVLVWLIRLWWRRQQKKKEATA